MSPPSLCLRPVSVCPVRVVRAQDRKNGGAVWRPVEQRLLLKVPQASCCRGTPCPYAAACWYAIAYSSSLAPTVRDVSAKGQRAALLTRRHPCAQHRVLNRPAAPQAWGPSGMGAQGGGSLEAAPRKTRARLEMGALETLDTSALDASALSSSDDFDVLPMCPRSRRVLPFPLISPSPSNLALWLTGGGDGTRAVRQ